MTKLKCSIYRGGYLKRDVFKIDKTVLNSRLIVGTGKYKSLGETAKAIKASSDMVTVAVRRVNIFDKKLLLMDYITKKINIYQTQQDVLIH